MPNRHPCPNTERVARHAASFRHSPHDIARPVAPGSAPRRRYVAARRVLASSAHSPSCLLPRGIEHDRRGDGCRGFHRSHRRFLSRVSEAVGARGGYVGRMLGDDALIFFGFPAAQEDDAEPAVLAALDIIARFSARPVCGCFLQVRIGLSTGLVLLGDVMGTGRPGSLDVYGETPNLAARLQAMAEPNPLLGRDAVAGEILAATGRSWSCAISSRTRKHSTHSPRAKPSDFRRRQAAPLPASQWSCSEICLKRK